MKPQLMYIEQKDDVSGPARVGWVALSRTGRTLHSAGRSFRSLRGRGYKANYLDVESGQWYWISRPRKDGMDSLYPARVEIDPDAREEYWVNVRGLPQSVGLAAFDSPGKHSRRKPYPELAVHGSSRNGGSRGGKRRD
jgi:hypothetical protein